MYLGQHTVPFILNYFFSWKKKHLNKFSTLSIVLRDIQSVFIEKNKFIHFWKHIFPSIIFFKLDSVKHYFFSVNHSQKCVK